jgi:hypothetical protein
VWLEERKPGPLLSELSGLSAVRLASILLDLSMGLAALHGSGLAHGHVAADRVVIQSNGRAQLIAAGSESGRVTQDLDDFRALMLRLWPENAAAEESDF